MPTHEPGNEANICVKSCAVETEFHFMLCPALDHDHLRSTFFSFLSDLDTSFTSLTLIDKF